MDVDRRSAGRCGLLRAEHPAKVHGFDLVCDLSDGKSRGERRRLVKPVLVVRKRRSGSSKLSELRTVEGTPKSTRSIPSRPGASTGGAGPPPPSRWGQGKLAPGGGPKKYSTPCMRHETADAARRESSKTVEFFEIGALQQKLCLRDADAVHRVHCDICREEGRGCWGTSC